MMGSRPTVVGGVRFCWEGDIGIIAGEITVGRQGAVADGSDTGALVGKAEWAAPRFSDSYYSCCQAACR